MFASKLQIGDVRCNGFMKKLSENLPDLDKEIYRTIQQIFFEHFEHLENFKACIEIRVSDPDAKAWAIKIAELYLQAVPPLLAEGDSLKRKGGFLQGRQLKRLRLAPREKRKAEEDLLEAESCKRRRLELATLLPGSMTTSAFLQFENKPLCSTVHGNLARLRAALDDEERIAICMHLYALAMNHRLMETDKEISKSAEGVSFLVSLLFNSNVSLVDTVWNTLKALLRKRSFANLFVSTKQIAAVLLALEKMIKQHEALTFKKAGSQPLDAPTVHLQSVLFTAYRVSLYCLDQVSPEIISDEIVQKAAYFYLSFLDQKDHEVMVLEAYNGLFSIFLHRKSVLPETFDIGTKVSEFFAKFSLASHPDIIRSGIEGIWTIMKYLPQEWKQIEDKAWDLSLQATQHENEDTVQFALMFLGGAAAECLNQKPSQKDLLQRLLKVVISFISHENCWVSAAAVNVLRVILKVEGVPQLFCQYEGVKMLISAIGNLASVLDSEKGDLAKRCLVNYGYSLLCLDRCLTFLTLDMAEEVVDLMMQLIHCSNNSIVVTSLRFLINFLRGTKEKFVDLFNLKVCPQNLLGLIFSSDAEIVNATLCYLNTMAHSTDFRVRCLESGLLEKLGLLLKQPQVQFVSALLICLCNYTRIKNGSKQVGAAFFESAFSLLHSEDESLLTAILPAFGLTVINDLGFNDDMGVKFLEKTMPLLKTKDVPLLKALYQSFGKLVDPQRGFAQCFQSLCDETFLKLVQVDILIDLLKDKRSTARESATFLMNHLVLASGSPEALNRNDIVAVLIGSWNDNASNSALKVLLSLLNAVSAHFPALFSKEQRNTLADLVAQHMRKNNLPEQGFFSKNLLYLLMLFEVELLSDLPVALQCWQAENRVLYGFVLQLIREHPASLEIFSQDDRLMLYAQRALSNADNAAFISTNFQPLALQGLIDHHFEFADLTPTQILIGYPFLERIYGVQELEQLVIVELQAEEPASLLNACEAQASNWSVATLMNGIKLLQACEFSPTECIELCQEIANQNLSLKQGLGVALIEYFNLFDLIDTPIESRVWLAEILIEAGNVQVLAKYFDLLGLSAASPDERCALYRKIVDFTGYQLETCKALASSSWGMASLLAENYNSLALELSIANLTVKLLELPNEKLLFAYPFLEKAYQHHFLILRNIVISKFLGKLDALLQHYVQLSLEEMISPQEQIIRVEMLRMAGGSFAQCIELCEAIARASAVGAELIVVYFKRLGLCNAPIDVRLLLCKFILGHDKSELLAANFALLGLDNLSSLQLDVLFKLPAEDILKGYVFFEKLFLPDPQILLQRLIVKMQDELATQCQQPEAAYSLALEICNNISLLQLQEDHPLILQAMEIGVRGGCGKENNPIALYRKLRKLAGEPLTKQILTPFDIARLQSTAARIERKDLPEGVSKIVFHALFNALQGKIFDVEGKVLPEGFAALKALGTTWEEISFPIEGDPSRFLLNLLQKADGAVSDVEAKWKAVLSNVFSKHVEVKENDYFTEQEEVFITTMMAIQACEGGKSDGITRVYNMLLPKYQYTVQLNAVLSVNAQESLSKLRAFLKNAPKEADLAEFLQASSQIGQPQNRELTQWAYGLFAEHPLLETFLWYDDDQLNGEMTLAGAQEIVAMIEEDSVAPLIAHSIHKALITQLSGDNAFMEELTQEEDLEHGSHQSIYLQNLLGPILGTSRSVCFDQHTSTLYPALIQKSREEVLEIFFKHFRPEVMARALMRDLNQASNDEKELMKKWLSQPAYWSTPSTITLEGAMELLRAFKYLKKD